MSEGTRPTGLKCTHRAPEQAGGNMGQDPVTPGPILAPPPRCCVTIRGPPLLPRFLLPRGQPTPHPSRVTGKGHTHEAVSDEKALLSPPPGHVRKSFQILFQKEC